MAGKARLPRTSVDRVVKDTVERKKQFGRERSLFAGIPQLLAVNGFSPNTAGGLVSQSQGLSTSGAPMIGPLAFHPVAAQIADGVLDVGTTGSSFSSRVIVLGQANPDNLCRIAGAAHAGQILFLQAVSTTAIVLKHETDEGSAVGNIYIPSGSDYTVAGKEIVLLQWDTINPAQGESTEYGQWTLVATSQGGGGTGMQNPAVAQFDMATFSIEGNWDIGGGQTNFLNVDPTVGIEADLDMNTFDIKDVCRLGFELGGTALPATISGISASSDRLHFNVPTGDYHYFTVNDDGRLKITADDVQIQNWIDIRNPTTTTPSSAGFGDLAGWVKIQIDGGNYSFPVWNLP